MMRIAIIVTCLSLVAIEAQAASDPQRISPGSPFPVYVNGTGTSQSNASGTYINQTQYTPAVATAQKRTLMGVGQ